MLKLRRSAELCGGQTVASLATASTLAEVQLSMSIDEVKDMIISEGFSFDVSTLTQEQILTYLAAAIKLRLARNLNGLSSSNSTNAANLISGMQACSGNLSFSFTVQAVSAIPGILPGLPSPSPSPVPSTAASSSPPYYIIGIIFGIVVLFFFCIVVARKRQINKEAQNNSVVLRTVKADTGAPVPTFTEVNKLFVARTYAPDQLECLGAEERAACNARILPEDIRRIISAIPPAALVHLGFQPEFSHPRDAVPQLMMGLPPAQRPTIRQSDGGKSRGEDDLTTLYQDILHTKNDCAELMLREKEAS